MTQKGYDGGSHDYRPVPEGPIGVFDSGLGGISVLREMVKKMPGEDFLYLGDSLHAPYGTKTLDEVRHLTYQSFYYMLDHGAKAVAIACNTATSAAVRLLREDYPEVPLIGIEPALKPAALENRNRRIVVLATPMTLSQEKFHNLLEPYRSMAEILPVPCPGLMEFVEGGVLSGPELESYLNEKFQSLPPGPPVDAVVLGCTHYPFVKEAIQKAAGEQARIYDGGEGCAREMLRRIRERSLENPRKEGGQVTFLNTHDTPEVQALALKLFQGCQGDGSLDNSKSCQENRPPDNLTPTKKSLAK